MIEIVTHENAFLYRDALEEMFRMRHRIFVEGMKWEALRKPDGREIDQFDTSDAIYILLTDDHGAVLGSHRLLPTTRPHLFSELFSDMCEQRGMQVGPRIYELNRTGVDSALPKDRQIWGLRYLMVGLFEFCRRVGIEQITLLTPLNTLYHCLMAGVQVKPLGMPRKIDEIPQAAVSFITDQTTLDNVRAFYRIPESVVRYIGAPGGEEGILKIPGLSDHAVAAE